MAEGERPAGGKEESSSGLVCPDPVPAASRGIRFALCRDIAYLSDNRPLVVDAGRICYSSHLLCAA